MRFSLVALTGALLLVTSARGAEEIKVPFNFQWGESAQRLESGLNSVKARVVERKKVRDRDCLVVEGIPQRLLQRALFYFSGDSLNEIELQYGDPAWNAAKYADFFAQTRANIERKYGTGRIIAQQNSQEDNIRQSLIGYQWTQPVTTLALYYYTAEKGTEALRVLSLHYRGF